MMHRIASWSFLGSEAQVIFPDMLVIIVDAILCFGAFAPSVEINPDERNPQTSSQRGTAFQTFFIFVLSVLLTCGGSWLFPTPSVRSRLRRLTLSSAGVSE